MPELPLGIYDHLITERLQQALDSLDSSNCIYKSSQLEEPLAPDYLTRFLEAQINKALKILPHDARLEFSNRIIQVLAEADSSIELSKLASIGKILAEVSPSGATGFLRPTTPLSSPSLFTGAGTSPQLGRELELELESADRVDMLVSFIKSAGVKLLMPSLKAFTRRGGQLRIITTTYLGASDPAAIKSLSELPNTKVRINYDTRHSRLHAKAYFIHRKTGLSCAFIGSANLSHAAMTSGLEWTVKLPREELPNLFRRCEAEFSSYWESPEFKTFETKDFGMLVEATRHEKGDYEKQQNTLTVFRLRPFDYQESVLESLESARSNLGHFRNLVIAATGTGKTMIAAFDYKRLSTETPKRLLFLAHRKEILEQARDTFRQVLQDGNFGDHLFDQHQPSSHDHLFCTIASFNAKELVKEFPASYWDVVILDEAHHGMASSYRPILDHLKPEVLLGLTATPERADGTSIADDFDSPVAGEIRLPDALEQKLLCPFHYYAISDHTTDLSSIEWKRGRYDPSALESVIGGNQLRAQLVLDKVIEHMPDPYNPSDFDRNYVKGLGFCVSKAHARFMAAEFSRANVPSLALDADTPAETRRNARKQLQQGDLNFIFTVDLFNEGVDIPETNCLLFLRPTESHVLYLQQFGRGLRHAEGKDQVIVLDFIPSSRREFRFDLRLSSLLPGKRRKLTSEIEHGFPHLPSGCHIHLERQARETILSNIRQSYANHDLRIQEAFKEWPEENTPTFTEFITHTNESPVNLLLRRSWSDWKHLCGRVDEVINTPQCPSKRSLARLSRVTCQDYLDAIAQLLTEGEEVSNTALAPSAHFLLWEKAPTNLGFESYDESFAQIRANESFCSDALEIIQYARTYTVSARENNFTFDCPLTLHANYGMREVSAAFGKANIETTGPAGIGVIHVPTGKVYLHFVTFEKTEELFSESTMYRDYPISRTQLHWESQSGTGQNTPTGQNYIRHAERGYTILFFARVRKSEGKLTSGFTFLGAGKLLSFEGDRPISIVWELEQPMPAEFYHEARQVSGL